MNAISKEPQAAAWRGERFALADLLRAFAAGGIVWHHLSLYAPRSDLADQFAPSVGYFLFNHALYAVAIFFVLGIFLGWTLQGRLPTWVLSLYSLSVAGSLMLNPRPQLMISLLVVPVLFFGYWRTKDWVLPASIRWLSDVSYSLFLVHYMVNGVVLRT